eukprot:CAMPEP_0185762960 /NCGR_PEP_ID=MMETSP1174-20130828/21926_1 /TAXON_ID=35687 /ORGANISM="Dictyocha speculum, Strain CCMP1381" /LENGTH=54 /DNA_ID=CAMNT_0028444865 /DNA_START=11 /DNA_END=175 /DNA_ORIENTATION=-
MFATSGSTSSSMLPACVSGARLKGLKSRRQANTSVGFGTPSSGGGADPWVTRRS